MYIGDFIKMYRKEHNMSMQDFANLTGLSKAYVAMLEKIYNPTTKQPISPSMDKMNQIARGVGIPFHELLARLGESNPLAMRPERTHKPRGTEFDENLPALSPRDERQIAKELEIMMKELDARRGFIADGLTPEEAEDRELFRASFLMTLRLAKRIAKQKYTPKKFRK